MKLGFTFSLAFSLLAWASISIAEVPGYPAYAPRQLPDGVITSVGSDSMGDLMNLWVEQYRKAQPKVSVQITNGGSAAAPAALIEGSADIGPMARPMKADEIAEFRARYGFEPTQLTTAYSAIAIYVPKNSPLKQITLDELDRIYSKDRRRAGGESAAYWSSLDVKGPFGDLSIMPIGASNDSLEQIYFRQQVMMQGGFVPTLLQASDTRALFETLAANPGSIGFGPLTTPPATVRVLPVGRAAGDTAVLPSEVTARSGSYPLARALTVYVIRAPFSDFDPATKDLLSFILSEEGQNVVRNQGLISVAPERALAELEKLN